ncbi:hypothetical protein DMUE_5457 [Dictyocoela muelleri]|nr:hypothetical protein DMUE_5457 [Dictyocoela muelleri]
MVVILGQEGAKRCALEATRTESFTQKSFLELINDNFNKKRDYYLARVRCQGNGNDVQGVYYCYDAKQLCRHVFEMVIGRTGRKIRIKSFIDPIHQRTIAELSFFKLRYDEYDLANEDTHIVYDGDSEIKDNGICGTGINCGQFGFMSDYSKVKDDDANTNSYDNLNFNNKPNYGKNYETHNRRFDKPPLRAEYMGNHVDFLESNSFRSKIFADEDAFDALSVTFDMQKKYRTPISRRKLLTLVLSCLFIFAIVTFIVFSFEKSNVNFFGNVNPESGYGFKTSNDE